MQYVLTEYELRKFAAEVTGRASAPFMKAAPRLVMPTEELIEGVDEMLKDWFGISPQQYEVDIQAGTASPDKNMEKYE